MHLGSEIKLIFIGGHGAGKTSAISAISDIPINQTNLKIPEYNAIVHKENLNIIIDYGELTLSQRQKLRLYGVPGQGRFDYVWKMLTKNAIGLILLINNAGTDPFGELARSLDTCREIIGELDTVIGITHADTTSIPNLQSYQTYLQQRGIQLPLFLIDARHHDNVMQLVQTLIKKITP